MKATDVASTLNKQRGAIYDIERGKINVQASDIAILANTYNLNPTWLILGTGDMKLYQRDDELQQEGMTGILNKVSRLLDNHDQYLVEEIKAEIEQLKKKEAYLYELGESLEKIVSSKKKFGIF